MYLERPVINGIYRHFKSIGEMDHVYQVIGVGKHSETEELFVVYRALYNNSWLAESNTDITIRPLDMFMEKIEMGGITKDRFELIFDPKVNLGDGNI